MGRGGRRDAPYTPHSGYFPRFGLEHLQFVAWDRPCSPCPTSSSHKRLGQEHLYPQHNCYASGAFQRRLAASFDGGPNKGGRESTTVDFHAGFLANFTYRWTRKGVEGGGKASLGQSELCVSFFLIIYFILYNLIQFNCLGNLIFHLCERRISIYSCFTAYMKKNNIIDRSQISSSSIVKGIKYLFKRTILKKILDIDFYSNKRYIHYFIVCA